MQEFGTEFNHTDTSSFQATDAKPFLIQRVVVKDGETDLFYLIAEGPTGSKGIVSVMYYVL